MEALARLIGVLTPYFGTMESAKEPTLQMLIEKQKNLDSADQQPINESFELPQAADEGPLTLCCLLNTEKQTANISVLYSSASSKFPPNYLVEPLEVPWTQIPDIVLQRMH